MSRVLVLALALASIQPPIALELRVFLGTEEVTSETRITVQKAGERGAPVAQATASGGKFEVRVPPGIYDVQAIREHEGRVANIRWAERLVVMPYADEAGHHLEIVNFTPGYGGLQVRASDSDTPPEVTLYKLGQRDRPAATPLSGSGYALFVVPAGAYDLQVRTGGRPSWHAAIEVPLDRTRLWMVPAPR